MKKTLLLLCTFLCSLGMWATDYELVTSASQLVVGAKYIMANGTSGSVNIPNTTSNANNRQCTTGTVTNNKITATDAMLVLELGGSSNAWTFTTTNYGGTDGFLYNNDTSNNRLKVGNDTNTNKFTISFSNNAISSITCNGNTSRGVMCFNGNLVACYASKSSSYIVPQLYKEVTSGDSGEGGDPEPTKYTVTIANDIANGSVVANPTSAAEGATVTLTPTPASGYQFGSWNVTNASTSAAITVTNNQFTMPAANVNVNATFTAEAQSYKIYSSGFESSEGFTATTDYASVKEDGPAAKKWGMLGTVTTNDKKSGSNGLQMRITKTMVVGTDANRYAQTNFNLNKICKVVFYHRTDDANCFKKIKLQYSLDAGENWADAEEFVAPTSWTQKTVTIPSQSENMRIRFYVSEWAPNSSNTKKYTIDDVEIYSTEEAQAEIPVNDLTISPAGGTYTSAQSVTLSALLDGSTIYYTTDGTAPTTSSTVYTSAINVATDMTVKALAVYDGAEDVTAEATYVINVAKPLAKIAGVPYGGTANYYISAATTASFDVAAGTDIYYTLDGSTPTVESTKYTEAIAINGSCTLKALASNGVKNSDVTSVAFVLVGNNAVLYNFNQSQYGYGVSTGTSDANQLADADVLTQDGVTITYTKGEASTNARFWDESNSNDIRLRVYNKSSLTFAAPEGKLISKIQIYGNNTGNIYFNTAEEANKLSGNTKDFGDEPVASALFVIGSGSAPKISSIVVTLSTPEPTTATISLNANCHDADGMVYGTYSNTSAWVVPSDVVVSEVSVIDGALYVEEYDEGAIVPANTGVMVSALEGGDYTIELSNEAGESVLGTNNCLHPSSEEMTGDNLFYRLTMHNGTQIGFWWGAENGATFTLAANKAYLAVPKSTTLSKSSFWLSNTATGINAVNTSKKNSVAYNLAGQRVNANMKGIVIINGNKFINK